MSQSSPAAREGKTRHLICSRGIAFQAISQRNWKALSQCGHIGIPMAANLINAAKEDVLMPREGVPFFFTEAWHTTAGSQKKNTIMATKQKSMRVALDDDRRAFLFHTASSGRRATVSRDYAAGR